MEWVKIDGMHLFLLDYIRPFLAMASLKSSRLWRYSSGFTKRFVFFRPISLYARCGLFEQKKEHA